MKGKIIKIEPISQKFHDIFRFTKRTAEVTLKDSSHHQFVRYVLETGPAVSVLPYFFDKKKDEWFVVMVSQYRPAVDAVCLEAPGGLLENEKKVKHEMARELLEEAGISVKPSSIKLTGIQHLANSFCDQVLYSGIVDLKIDSAEKLLHLSQKHGGVASEKEFTQVVIRSLRGLLKNSSLITYTLAKYQINDLAVRLNYFSKNQKTKKSG